MSGPARLPTLCRTVLAIIIITKDAEDCLPAVLPGVSEADDLIISDGLSQDATLRIAAEAGARLAIGSPSRGGQFRRGVQLAHDADAYLFLHADSQLPDNWKNIASAHFKSHGDQAGYFRLRFDSANIKARIIEILVRLRCRFWGLPYGDQGLLISRELYEAAGGFPNLPLFEDVKLAESLGRRRLRQLPATIITSAHKFERDGWFKRSLRNLRFWRRYRRGEPVEKLAEDYS